MYVQACMQQICNALLIDGHKVPSKGSEALHMLQQSILCDLDVLLLLKDKLVI